MNPNLVLVTILTLTGLLGPGPASAPFSATVAAPSTSSGPTDPVSTAAEPGSSDGVSVRVLDIVVPSVTPSGQVGEPNGDAGMDGTADSVVADQLVASERLESNVVDAAGFQTLGVTWPEGEDVTDLGAQVRTRVDGKWSPWGDLAPSDDAPDPGTADAAHAVRGGTDALAIGDVEAVQMSFSATSAGGPDGLSLSLVGSEQTPTPDRVIGQVPTSAATVESAAFSTSTVATSLATVSPPRIISRAEWGAPAQVCTPDVASTLVGAVVHHTADSNAYSNVAEAKQQIRNDAVYHIGTRGWCDIGYNFIVDKWGNIYEGRANSLTEAVIGVHAGGFNTGTVGVAMLGTYDSIPSAATQRGVAQIIGWRLGAYSIDPRGAMNYYTGVGENSRFKNQNVFLPRVIGHRDVAFTACPGNGGYAALTNIRDMAWDLRADPMSTNLLRTVADSMVYLVTSSAK
ncbi:MAG: N-acetylmuramoyl-L-alanine amidase, partial [Cellulomonas sp.]